jgi:carbohydrate kinase (thermoresistant glucokinase family)
MKSIRDISIVSPRRASYGIKEANACRYSERSVKTGPEPGAGRGPAPLVIVLMGVAGCGKSTTGNALAKALGWPFRDADSFHPAINIEKMSKGLPLEDEDRWPWLSAIAEWIDERRRTAAPAIVSCSALKRAYRALIVGDRQDVQLVYLKGGADVIRRRLEARKNHFMPASLLDSQLAVLEEPGPMSPRKVAAAIVEQLALATPAVPARNA